MVTSLPRGIGLVGWYYIGIHLLLVWVSVRSGAKIDRMATLPPRERYFLNTILIQLMMLLAALLVSKATRMHLLPLPLPGPWGWCAGVATAALLGLGMTPLWKRAVGKRPRRLHFFMPSGPREKALWVGVSLAAGVGEEVAYRGVLFVLLATVTGSVWAGALLSAVIFALAHAIQSRLSMLIIFGFALIFQALALAFGTLLVPMVAHVLYDVIAGFTYSRLGREANFRPELEPAPAAAMPVAAARPDAPGA